MHKSLQSVGITIGEQSMLDPMHTRLCDEYGCEVPICAFAHTKDVIVAVTNAGGIGILGGVGRTPDELRLREFQFLQHS